MSAETDVVPAVKGAATVTLAVVGNPNTGKSTLFSALTGVDQQVGNYPGITVERKHGSYTFGNTNVTVVDLPGTYSLAAASQDEQVVVDVLHGRFPDEPQPIIVVCVADATNLRRNLFLPSQIAEIGLPLVIALNMADEAEKRGMRVDAAKLQERLGVPVVPTVATEGKGIDALRAAVAKAVKEPGRFPPVPWPPAVVEALRGLREAAGDKLGESGLVRLLFDAESPWAAELGLTEARDRARKKLEEAKLDPVSAEAILRYDHLGKLVEGTYTPPDVRKVRKAYAIDKIFTHRFLGLVVFTALMFAVFSSIYWLAGPLMNGIEWLKGSLAAWAGARLEGHPMLQSLVVGGLIEGVGAVVIFLPQILILFLFVAILEDSGYMARAAFLMDKVFSWTGLNGKSFVPMLSSFACAVPAILATRTIEDPKARLSTILVAPLMSCSARLPVYVLLIGAFIEPVYGWWWAGAALFGLHILGLVVAIPIAWFINRFMLKLRSLPFLLEMPPYRWPRAKGVARRMYFSGKEFVLRAGTVIFAFSVVIWALTYFPRPDSVREEIVAAAKAGTAQDELERQVNSAYMEQSLMGRFGKFVQPAFAPAGFDWKITVGVLAAFPAREVIVSTLGVIYSVEEEDDAGMKGRLQNATWPDGRKVFTLPAVLSILIFFAFCLQCGSTVAVIARESGWKWAWFAFVYMTGLAWVGAVLTYQIGSAL